MQTIAFYSYKGGVGRSLLLANAARFLSLVGKRVVALDLDLEAPSLHYKLGGANVAMERADGARGAVPYLVGMMQGVTSSPPPLVEHIVDVPVPEETGGWLRLMPAGPAPHRTYWTALKQLVERMPLDGPSGEGLAALLDLHARIEDEIQPDYLLIDARTGVTELGGLATTILADTVVCLFVANQESVDGTLTIVEALKAAKRLRGQAPVRVVPVLARATSSVHSKHRFGDVAKRLFELGEGRHVRGRDRPEPFLLPHDEVHGATDIVVAGERTASAFSPLHQAYLEIFQHLFPDVGSAAQRVMNRIEAIARVRAELTKEIPRPSPLTMAFSPWKEADIIEGQAVEMGRGEKSRYADLVCRGEGRKPVLVVEYVEGGSAEGARSAWDNLLYSGLRCLVLVDRKEGGQVSETVYTEHPKEHLLRPTERWNLPRPGEFEILRDVGDLSVESMLDAVRRGHPDYLQPLVHRWQRSISVGPHGGGPWIPEVARTILDGLTATDDKRVGVLTLMHAAPDPYHREHQGMGIGAEIERWSEQELFAPLFWRLPVEAAFGYQREHRMELPSVAGHKLLAEDVMGLHYDVYRTFRRETDALARRAKRDGLRQLTENYAIHDLYHLWRREELKYAPSGTPPAALVRDGLTVTDGRSDKLDEEERAVVWANELLQDKERLGSWLANCLSHQELVTNGLLGSYDPPSGILSLHTEVLSAVAPMLGIKLRQLNSVVFIHLSVLAYAHQARDLDGLPGYGFASGPSKSPFHPDNPIHAVIAQYFVFKLIERLDDPNLKTAFDKLSDHQPRQYRRWRVMHREPLERMRMMLMRARLGDTSSGLSGLPAADP